jgi:hypothetical protein
VDYLGDFPRCESSRRFIETPEAQQLQSRSTVWSFRHLVKLPQWAFLHSFTLAMSEMVAVNQCIAG